MLEATKEFPLVTKEMLYWPIKISHFLIASFSARFKPLALQNLGIRSRTAILSHFNCRIRRGTVLKFENKIQYFQHYDKFLSMKNQLLLTW